MPKKSYFIFLLCLLTAIGLLSSCGSVGEDNGEQTSSVSETVCAHVWLDATHYEPKTCSLCGVTEGEPLQADFEKYGLECAAEVGERYDYITHCTKDETLTTKGTAVIKEYMTLEEDEDHGKKDGYEWKIVRAEVTFRDINAYDKGFAYSVSADDYYDVDGRVRTYRENADGSGTYEIRYNGKDCILTEKLTAALSGWNDFGVNTLKIEYAVQVPKGYDGAVLVLLDSASRQPGQRIYEANTDTAIFFRLK